MADEVNKKTIDETRRYVENVAKHRGGIVNSDTEHVGYLIEGLTTNWNRYGYYNCPCRLSKRDRNVDRDIICPCDYAQPDIEEFGHCYCGLFLSKEFAISGKEIGSIPERRKR
ncbi:MAG: ferredoxin-thioredoxin reductase catalytic domain-containing protein [Candidatus Odinarchaeia archaeon]